LEPLGSTRNEINNRIDELMDELKIGYLADNKGHALSGGERRRVEIMRALATRPRFILLDEPFAGVDPLSVADLQQIIRSLKEKELGVLISDHNVRETLQVCDFAYIMNNGRILTSGAAADIIESTLARKMYLGDNFSM
ncbi:MAG TPA: ATP-binding cassette domain-containing protein, partial [Desulfobulbaceae bacterium]|nr:ATP-binding cassette domain-containing protein [Desulfobulbaceae bacterium]